MSFFHNGNFGRMQSLSNSDSSLNSSQISLVSDSYSMPSTSNNWKFYEGIKSSSSLKSSNYFKAAPLLFADDNSPITLFFTKLYCFSNHFSCNRLVIDGVNYVCTEQYYMYYKAFVFGDIKSAKLIMATKDPKIMKRIGSDVVGFDQDIWFSISILVMVIASLKKYEQNPELRRQLFETADTLLVEASPTDDRWGIGLSMDSEFIRMKSLWRGQNIMGRLLTKLRDRLLERSEFSEERRRLFSFTEN